MKVIVEPDQTSMPEPSKSVDRFGDSDESLKALLRDIVQRGAGIRAEERARIPRADSMNLDHYHMAIYSACDAGLMVSMGEDMGLTVAEMQACERPVIVSDFSAQPELLGDGWLVKGQPRWDAAQHGWSNQPIVGNIVEALEAACGRGMSVKARAHIVDNFDADMGYQPRSRTFLAELEASL